MSDPSAAPRRDRLARVHPDLVAAVLTIQGRMLIFGRPMLVTDGARTLAEQATLYAQGRTLPGRIVTFASGLPKAAGGTGVSKHQVTADGFGHAVDMCFLVAGVPSWAEGLPWDVYGALAIELGLEWGGAWAIPDRPHIQLRGSTT